MPKLNISPLLLGKPGAEAILLRPGVDGHNAGTEPDFRREMCVQVDKQWSCGHVGYFQIRWCEKLFKGCKGTSAAHDIIYQLEECSDCIRLKGLPKPFTSK